MVMVQTAKYIQISQQRHKGTFRNKCKRIEGEWAICSFAHMADNLSRFCIGSLNLLIASQIKHRRVITKEKKAIWQQTKRSPPLWEGRCLDHITSTNQYIFFYFRDGFLFCWSQKVSTKPLKKQVLILIKIQKNSVFFKFVSPSI